MTVVAVVALVLGYAGKRNVNGTELHCQDTTPPSTKRHATFSQLSQEGIFNLAAARGWLSPDLRATAIAWITMCACTARFEG